MLLQAVRFAAVILTALGLSLGVAHVLELPPRMKYDAELYLAVTSTLYRMYAWVGAVAQVGSILVVAAQCWLVRGRKGFGFTVAALVAFIASMMLWATIVQPVNARWAGALESDASGAATVYLRLRPRWEYGHVAAAAAWFTGFVSLVLSLLVEMPRAEQSPDAA